MITILAEKPAQARIMAGVVGADQDRGEWFEGNGYYVTWCLGHLVTIDTHLAREGWGLETLPLDPDSFTLVPRTKDSQGRVPDPEILKRLDVIKTLFEQSESLIEATDAGREGENIFRNVYNYLGCKKPFKRLWADSLTEDALRRAFDDLRPGSDYDLKGVAAHLREESDWRYGINATRAATLTAGTDDLLSAGRVQMAALKLICDRHTEYEAFEPAPYWLIRLETELDGVRVKWRSAENFRVKETAQAVLETIRKDWTLTVSGYKKDRKTSQPPLLHNLGTVQKEANARWGYTASRTSEAVQYLYERQLVTYPRTESRYISHDEFSLIPEIIRGLEGHPLYGKVAKALARRGLSTRCVNDAKCIEHPPLIVTSRRAGKLDEVEARIYDLILSRTLEAFCPDSESDVTHLTGLCAGRVFLAKGSQLVSIGWKCVKGKEVLPAEAVDDAGPEDGTKENEPELSNNIPEYQENTTLSVVTLDLKQDETKPRPELTDATLISLLEGSGSRKGGGGIGTMATRAMEIDILVDRGYVKRDEKTHKLIPTRLGMDFYESMSDTELCDINLTAKWETLLQSVEDGICPPDMVNTKVRKSVNKLTKEIMVPSRFEKLRANNPAKIHYCPDCGAEVKITMKGVKCPVCPFHLYASKAGKNLTRNMIAKLLRDGRTEKLSGFKRRDGTSFSAVLILEKGGNVSFLSDRPTVRQDAGFQCPRCGNPMVLGEKSVSCPSCHLPFYFNAFGAKLTPEEIRTLITEGKVRPVDPFKKKDGSGTYDAELTLDADWHYALSFDEKPVPETLVICRQCGRIMKWSPKDVSCQCGFSVRRKAFGRDLSDDEVVALSERGKVGPLSGFVSKKGKNYEATLMINEEGKTVLTFDN